MGFELRDTSQMLSTWGQVLVDSYEAEWWAESMQNDWNRDKVKRTELCGQVSPAVRKEQVKSQIACSRKTDHTNAQRDHILLYLIIVQ